MSSYLPAKFAFCLKISLIFNIFYCFRMFVNKNFTYLGRIISLYDIEIDAIQTGDRYL